MSTTTPKMADDLVWRLLDDNAVIVTPQSGQVRVFNEVGALIWKMLADGNSIDEIEHQIANTYDISEAAATSDVQNFLADLRQRGLLK